MIRYKVLFSRLNDDGEVKCIHYNNQVRSRAMTKDVDETKDFYAAMKLYDNLLYSDKYMLHYKLKDGEKVSMFQKSNAILYCIRILFVIL